jgi:diacylglycerol kinase family enzyme
VVQRRRREADENAGGKHDRHHRLHDARKATAAADGGGDGNGGDGEQDVAEVDYVESKYRQTRHMANVAGLGFDAKVIQRTLTSKAKGYLGRGGYLWCLVRSFFSHKATGVKIWIDDKLVYNNLLFSIAIGVGKYNGGGIQQLPAAVADDELLDVTLIRPVHWWHVIFRLRRLFNGTIYSIGHVTHAQGKKIRIESTPETPLEIDGELYGGTPVEFRVRHREVRVIVNKSFLDKIAKGR